VLRVLGHLAAGAGVDVVTLAGRRSPLAEDGPWRSLRAEDLPIMIGRVSASDAPWLLLVDDADTINDADSHLRALLGLHLPSGHIVAAGRADRIRSAYGSWIHELRESRAGIALRPNVDLDGDLWQTALPRRPPTAMSIGRGYRVSNGEVELIQAACVR
jgi:S-DNA-T family DNA segregation ATPase FtsK/SpoIIIE